MRSLRQLTEQERSSLESELKKAKNAADWKRLFVIISYDEGLSIAELAKLTRLSPWTVEEYLKEYSSKNKTKNDPRGGGSSKFSEEQAEELERHLRGTTYLKVKTIVDFVIQKFGYKYSVSGMRDWLINRGFTFKKPQKIPGKLDPIKQAEFIEMYKQLKSSLEAKDKIYFLDAVHPEYQSQAVCGWIKKGEIKTLQTTGKQKRLHIVGALNLKKMGLFMREYETIDGDAIVNFFRDLELSQSDGRIHVILDNAAAHKNQKVTDYLKTSRIKLHYLPPYSPNLNPIERLWKLFREMTLYNRYFETWCDFFETVREFFADKVHKISDLLRERINDNFQIIELNPIKLA